MDVSETEIETLLKAVQARTLGKVRTALPGIIDSFDPETQTATARVSVASWRINPDTEEPEAYYPPAATNAPVYFPAGGGWSMRFPIDAGDECIVLVAERSISEWMTTGNRSIPGDLARRFDLTDALILPGLRPSANPLQDFDDAALELTHTSGTTLRLNETGKVFLGNSTADLVSTARSVQDLLQTVITSVNTFAAAAALDPVATATAAAAGTLATALGGLSATIAAINAQFSVLEE